MGRVKISDIAIESGVSVATVSLVLNNRPGVSQETRVRVMETAERLGYTPKAVSGPVDDSPISTIVMAVKTEINCPPQANPFYSQVLFGMEEACRRRGINLLFVTLPVDSHNCPVEIPQSLYSEDVNGLLMVGTFVDETITSLGGRRIPPVVLVDAYSDTESYDSVVSDNFRASYQAVEYLLQKGHRHIALVGSEPNSYPSLRDRRNGYLRALKEHGIGETYLADFNLYQQQGQAEIATLLKENPQITAVFGVNDLVAVSAMRVAQEMGLRVPQDLSVIGYDDTYLAINAVPHLTTMHVDTTAMGYAAVQLLALRLENPEAARMTLTIHPTLVERESVVSL